MCNIFRSILLCCVALASGCVDMVVPPMPLPTSQGRIEPISDPCIGKSQCVLVYLAPWCPVCHASLPFIKILRSEIAKNMPNVGMRIVVGWDEPDKVLAMARAVGGDISLDADGKFKSSLALAAVPYWIVVDDRGNSKVHFSAGVADLAPNSAGAAQFAKKRLMLK